jgi:hypothetical protein
MSEEVKEEAKVEQSAGSKVSTMKAGEYVLHILVEKAKSLELDGHATFDPLVKIKFNGTEKKTSAKSDMTTMSIVKYEEHIFIETGKLTEKEIAASLIEVEVENKGFFSGDKMGYFPISTTTVYNLDNHVTHNTPLALTNPNADDKSKISGYLTLSINLSGPGDEAAQLKMGSDSEVAKKDPWQTPNIKTVKFQYYFKFLKAVGLPATDMLGTIDAYVKYQKPGGDVKLKTTHNAAEWASNDSGKYLWTEWNQEMMIPLEFPTNQEDLVFNVLDYNTIKDEFVGNLQFKIDDLEERLKEEKVILEWFFIYGCHQGNTGKIADE